MEPNERTDSPELTRLSIEEYLARLASAAPAPGGGSAAALAGAQAAALTRMVAGLTIGRKRYARVQQDMIGFDQQATGLQKRLTDLVDEDARAFDRVYSAYQMPQDTSSDTAKRQEAIQSALREAIATPLATIEACAGVLRLASQVAMLGNRNASGDAYVATFLARAGLMGARRNAQINLAAIHDETFRHDTMSRMDALMAAVSGLPTEGTSADENK